MLAYLVVLVCLLNVTFSYLLPDEGACCRLHPQGDNEKVCVGVHHENLSCLDGNTEDATDKHHGLEDRPFEAHHHGNGHA